MILKRRLNDGHPRVLDEAQTMRRVADGNLSMARFGRCELKLMQGRDGLAQPFRGSLKRMLHRVMRLNTPGLIACLPRIFERMPPGKDHWYGEFLSDAVGRELFYNRDRVFGSTFVTRRDAWVGMADEEDYWRRVRGIWAERPVLLVAGSGKGLVARESGFLGTAASVQVLQSEQQDAWSDRDRVLSEALRWADICRSQLPLVYLALGATATVLAFELTLYGVQALDMGHCAQSWKHAGKMAQVADA